MLQQTRVATVIPYYERFTARFPNARTMAETAEEEVLRMWAGLGYYSRARNLHRAAKAIHASGAFPQTYDAIRALPGLGDYTAAAVASIAFGLPHASVDGNVLRVLSRTEAHWGDIRRPAARRELAAAAQQLLDPRHPAEFNQALMELGATICVPRNPRCAECPWRDDCLARSQGVERQLPVRAANGRPTRIELRLLLVERDGSILMKRRHAGSPRLAGFWELPEAADLPRARLGAVLGGFRHGITNHDYNVEVLSAQVRGVPRELKWKTQDELARLPVSTMARKAFRLARNAVPTD